MLHGQRGFIPAFLIPYIGYALAGLAVVAILGFLIGKYNDGIRDEATKPLKQQIAQMESDIERNKVEAAEKIAAAKRENAELKLVYDKQAEVKDADYKKQIAAILARTNAGNGLRFNDPNGRNGCSPTREAGKDSAGTPEAAAPSGQLSTELSNLLWAEAGRADQIAAYAESCHAFVNGR